MNPYDGEMQYMRSWLKEQYGGHPNWKEKVDKMTEPQVYAVYCRLGDLAKRHVDTYIYEHGDHNCLQFTRLRFKCECCGCDFETDGTNGMGYCECPECGAYCYAFNKMTYYIRRMNEERNA